MIKSVLLMSVLLLSMGAAEAKTHSKKSAPKQTKEQAQELCLTTKGASIPQKELKKCIKKVMRTGKV